MTVYTEGQYDIIHETKIDFVLRPVTREIHLVQNDKSLPIVKVDLYANDKKYVIPDNITVKVRFGMHNKVEVYKDILGTNQAHDAIYFTVDDVMTSYDGKFIAVLELIFDANRRGSSSPILIVIDKDPMSIIR